MSTIIDDHLLDERALMRIAAEIDRCLDTKNWADFRELVCDTVSVQSESLAGPGTVEMSAEQLIHSMLPLNGPDRLCFHSRSNTLIDVDGNSARLLSHYTVWNRRLPPAEALYEMWGSLEYRFRRADGRWRVAYIGVEKWSESGALHPPGEAQ